ncbi:MAG TPA: restriction endonuclease subunit S [Verrucomicrobiae bacterium]|jgi:type I restriction enzyme S subunit|nr:restriction endonuclease subunit S [Verrucomicrobiae bacterium]
MGADYEQYPFPKGKHPSSWVETTVGEVMLEIRSGYASGKHNQLGSGIPHLRPMNVSPNGEISMEDVRYVSPAAGNLRLAKGDVLFTNTSSTVWVGKTALVEELGDWGFSNHMTRLRAAEGLSPEFAARQLHYLCLTGYFAFHCKKHINQSSVSGAQLAKNVPFRLPPANEQRRIAAKLRRLLDRERNLRLQFEALPGLIHQYRTAVLEAACAGRLVATEVAVTAKPRRSFETVLETLRRIPPPPRPNRFASRNEDVLDIGHPVLSVGRPERQLPDGWQWTPLVDIARMESGHTPSRSRPEWWNGEVPWIGIVDARENHGGIIQDTIQHTNEAGLENSAARLLPSGTVCVSRTASVGYVVVLGRPMATSQDFVNWTPTEAVLSGWLKLAFMADKDALVRFGKGAVHTTIYFTEWLSMHIALPPLSEQRRIVKEAERLLAASEMVHLEVQTAVGQAASLRKSLFQRALSGRLVLKSRSDEPASQLLLRIRKLKSRLAKQPKTRASPAIRPKPEKVPMLTLDEIKPTHLADILRQHNRPIEAKALWEESQLTIDDFYAQLKKERRKNINETGAERLLEVKS